MTACSEGVAEPLAGTAPTRRYWWVIEHPGPWPAHPITPEVLGDAAPWAVEVGDREDTYVVLARQSASGTDTSRVWFADTQTATLSQGTASLALPDVSPVAGSLTLVCTHGKRDRCCAVLGRPMLSVIPDAWECTHIGGHRFAPTILSLPHGLVFGRVRPQEWAQVASLGPGAVAWLRGRVALEPDAQVVDAYARAQWDLDLITPVTCHLERDDTPHRSYRVSSGEHRASALLVRDEVTVAASCGADPRPQQVWRVSRWE